MTIPTQAGKTSLEKLRSLPRVDYDRSGTLPDETTVLNFKDSGFQFDFLWRPKPNAKKLFVLFSGDALRTKNDPPVFQRWTWAKHFPGHCLYISDPSLYLDGDLGLAWYAGTEDFDPLPVIATALSRIAKGLNLTDADIVTYGSSGGGFAALRLATFLPLITPVAINPQTCITDYEFRNVEKYLRVCFSKRTRKQAIQDFPERLSLLENAERLAGTRLIIAQNVLDTHHYEMHFKPFCAAIGRPDTHDPEDPVLARIHFSNEGGHGKAEDPVTFEKILSLIK